MGLNHYKRLLRFAALISVAMALAMGCADGKPKKRQPVKKNPSSGQIDPKTGKPVVPKGSGNTSTPEAPGKTTPAQETEEERQKKAETLKKQTEAESRFDGQMQQATSGQLMEKSALEDGIYKLNTVTTALKSMPTKGGWLRAFRVQKLSLDATDRPMFSDEPASVLGSSMEDPDIGRNIEVPMSFKVKKESGVFRGERDSFSQFVLFNTRVVTQMNKGEFKGDIVNQATGSRAERASAKASVAELLSTNHLESKAPNDLKYSATEGSVQIDLRLRKVSDQQIRVVFEILESKDPNKVRTVILDYDFEVDKEASTGQEPKSPEEARTPPPGGMPAPEEERQE